MVLDDIGRNRKEKREEREKEKERREERERKKKRERERERSGNFTRSSKSSPLSSASLVYMHTGRSEPGKAIGRGRISDESPLGLWEAEER